MFTSTVSLDPRRLKLKLRVLDSKYASNRLNSSPQRSVNVQRLTFNEQAQARVKLLSAHTTRVISNAVGLAYHIHVHVRTWYTHTRRAPPVCQSPGARELGPRGALPFRGAAQSQNDGDERGIALTDAAALEPGMAAPHRGHPATAASAKGS